MNDSITVLVFAYNGKKYIRDQLDSIIAQTILPEKIIVVDDASSDNTVSEINKSFFSYPGKYQIAINEKNLGLKQSITKWIPYVDTDWILLADQDDVWLPNKIERIKHYIHTNQQSSIIFTNAFVTDENLKIIDDLWKTMSFSPKRTLESSTQEKALLLPLLKKNFATGATMAIKTRFAINSLPITKSTCCFHDYWFTLNGALQNSVIAINEKLIYYRQHSGNTVGSKSSSLISKIKRTLTCASTSLDDASSRLVMIEDLIDKNGKNKSYTLLKEWEYFEYNRDRIANSSINKISKVIELQKLDYKKFGRSYGHRLQDIWSVLRG